MSFRPTRLPQPTIGGMNVSVSYLCELVFSEPIINFTIPSRLSRRHTDSVRVREMDETSHTSRPTFLDRSWRQELQHGFFRFPVSFSAVQVTPISLYSRVGVIHAAALVKNCQKTNRISLWIEFVWTIPFSDGKWILSSTLFSPHVTHEIFFF